MTTSSPQREQRAARRVDFDRPAGEAALIACDSVSWRVFRNPLTLYIGGITAVLLEFAEPRVRTGVWENTSFRADPLTRLKRTGLAAMVTVYAARSVAERMIAGVTRRHERIVGATPEGTAYKALEPELMNWVQATASFGFLQAYHQYAEPLSKQERDRFYLEAIPAANLYGATGAPRSEDDQEALFDAMFPGLEPHAIVKEFLHIMQNTRALPWPLRPLSGPCLRAAVELLPENVRAMLDLRHLRPNRRWERRLLGLACRMANRVTLRMAPPSQACGRLGLPSNYLYQRR